MTEEEAKTRWCPFVGRMVARNEELRPGENDNPNCIGSACMAWRWLPHEERISAGAGFGEGRYGIAPIPGTIGADVPEKQVRTSWKQTVPNTRSREGYCGLAGKP